MKNRIKSLSLTTIFALIISVSFAQKKELPEPDFANVSYGNYERNVLDIWLAKTNKPCPLVVYIHGGGFKAGSKESLKFNILTELLEAGISVAAINYRYISQAPLPAAHEDSKLALQFLRNKAKEWNIDNNHVAAFGGSAGAQICMWLAFSDEMANPAASNPIEKESTRLTCVATNGGQTTMDFDLWVEWIPGYDKPHVDLKASSDIKTEEELKI